MSEYSVEIERLVVRLENLFLEGASLEPTLLERIRLSIQRFPEMAELDDDWPGAGWYRGDFLAAEKEASEKSAAVEMWKIKWRAVEREISEKSAVEEMWKIEWRAAEREASCESAVEERRKTE